MAGYANTAKRSILSSNVLVQLPFIRVTIGKYTFGTFAVNDKFTLDDQNFYMSSCNIMYPNYVQSLTITKINGQVNQYSLSLAYPVTLNDDPNFIEKVLSSVSDTRRIVFSYGDMNMPSYIYKDEEAIITKVNTRFDLRSGAINYDISATSTAILDTLANHTFKGGKMKPSEEIVRVLKSDKKLANLFNGMNESNYHLLIDHTDKEVEVNTKTNISSLDWVNYLVSCMIPAETTNDSSANSDIYALVIHDDTSYDQLYSNFANIRGSYFTVERISHRKDHSDALELDIGFGNSNMLITNFTVENNENYSLLYKYVNDNEDEYVERIGNDGNIFYAWAPQVSSKNSRYETKAEDLVWYTKLTKYPIKATIVLQGLLRSVHLMTYIRLNVLYPGGQKHLASGLYLITKQTDQVNSNGYRTTLNLTRIGGDE